MTSEPKNARQEPRLARCGSEIRYLADPSLLRRSGILVAFSERTGGHSSEPFDTLNLAGHVGDDPASVDRNRSALLDALGVGELRGSLVTAVQTHGSRVALIGLDEAGMGSSADMLASRVADSDAMVTLVADIPLMMLYADCVPIILVAEERRGVAVVHAGWRGTLAGVVSAAVDALCRAAETLPSELAAYVGPHIGECCYRVDERLLSQFANTFDTIAPAEGRLDLAAAVHESLTRSGLTEERIVHAGLCTLDNPDRFFSFRGHAVTGRQAAIAVVKKGA